MSSAAVNHPKISNYYVPVLLVVPTLGTIAAIVLMFFQDVPAVAIALCVTLSILIEGGVTFGYHRLIVHKSFATKSWIRAIAVALGSMAFQGPVINWASVHTKHHAMSDEEGDPHTPSFRGFWFAHTEWLLEMNSSSMSEIRAKYGGRYLKDPMLVWFDKTFLLWSAIGLIIPFAIGGWMGLLWGGLVRIFITSHVTWSVNSVCHYFGNRMFSTKDKSRNNFLVGVFALGEGWHNNHHAFPSSAFHGLRWWQIDLTAYAIRVLEKLGLASNVVRIPKAYLEKRLAADAGGSPLPAVAEPTMADASGAVLPGVADPA